MNIHESFNPFLKKSTDLSIKISKKKKPVREIPLDLISLPDQNQLSGSWKILLGESMHSASENYKTEIQSEKLVQTQNLNEFMQDIENKSVIKVVAQPASNSNNDFNIYSDSSYTGSFKIYIEKENGNKSPIMNPDQNELYQTLYEDIIRVEKGEQPILNDMFPLNINHKDAMVMLNESFTLNNLEDQYTIEDINPSTDPNNLFKKSPKINKDKTSAMTTKRTYTRKITQHKKLLNEPKTNTNNNNPNPPKGSVFLKQSGLEKRKTVLGKVIKNELEDENLESQNISVSEYEELSDDENKFIENVKVQLEVKRELWISLRMAPVLSYAPQIKENIDALGFEIKFIEDLITIDEEREQIVKQKIEEKDKKSVNNMSVNRFNKLFSKTFNKRNLPEDQNILINNPSVSINTLSMQYDPETLKLMDTLKQKQEEQIFCIESQYKVYGNDYSFSKNLSNTIPSSNKFFKQTQEIKKKPKMLKYHELLLENSPNPLEYMEQFQQYKKVGEMEEYRTTPLKKKQEILIGENKFKEITNVKKKKKSEKPSEGFKDEFTKKEPKSAFKNMMDSYIKKSHRIDDSDDEDDIVEISEKSLSVKKNSTLSNPDNQILLKKQVKYIVLMTNSNEKFLYTTFEVLKKFQKRQKKQKVKFGCSLFVYPKENYTFNSILSLQPPKVQKSIKKHHNYNMEFLPIEENVISLELNDIMRDLFVKNDKQIYKLLAEYLYKINFIFGKIDDYLYKGSLSQKVLNLFIHSVWESELGKQEANPENDFHKIREWANTEFALYEDDEQEEIEKHFRMDGQGHIKGINQKVSNSFLIEMPRDSKGDVLIEHLNQILNGNKLQNKYKVAQSGKRKTFLHSSNKFNFGVLSKNFLENHSKLLSTSLKGSLNFKTNRGGKSFDFRKKKKTSLPKKEESFDSHTDSNDFDPNKQMYSDQESSQNRHSESNLIFQDFDVMIILDRTNDLVTPFVSQSSYLGLIDDLLKSKNNQFN